MIRKILLGFIIFIVVAFLFFYCFQELFIFRNGKPLPKNYIYKFTEQYEELNLTTEDHISLNALHFKKENSKGVILYFHGNRGNLSRWGNEVSYLLDYNYDVFVFDYRNYGKSDGKFEEDKLYADALFLYDYLQNDYSQDQIIVYGRSLGATFATHVASNKSPSHLILEAPFYNLKKATKFNVPIAPLFLLRYQFPTNKRIGQVSSPVTIFHGDQDKTISFTESKELYNLVTSSQKQFIEIKSATHHNVSEFTEYHEILEQILN